MLGRQDHEGQAARRRQRAHVLARAGHQRAARGDLRGHVAAERRGELQQQGEVVDAGRMGRQAQRGGGVARAAAHAGGDGHALADRQPLRRRVPAGRGTEGGQRGAGEVVALDAGADDLVGRRAARGLQGQLVGERHGLHDGHERVQAVRARRPDIEAEVDLAGREAAEPQASLP